MTKTEIPGSIDELGEAGAVIRLADGQLLRWPLAALPDGLAEGKTSPWNYRASARIPPPRTSWPKTS